MNDNELSSMVRESVAGIRSSTPVDQIISRGHAVRAWRRRVPAAAGALVVAGAAALGVTALAPAGHLAPAAAGQAGSHPAVVRLTAWTVAKQPSGEIDVTIRQLQHPAQLQATLRADGLPAHVSFSPDSTDAACRTYADPRTESPKQRVASLKTLMSVAWANYDGATMFLAIHPSKLPSGAGLAIIAIKGGGAGLSLVHASQQCTG
jgi:hypothetical protein